MKIDLMSYREWARTKRPVGMSDRDQILDAALGLAGESAELLDVTRGLEFPPLRRILDEAGDVLFYAVWMIDVCESIGLVPLRGGTFPTLLDIPERSGCRDPDILASIRFGRVVEAVKKHVFHHRPLDGLIYDHIYRGLIALHLDLVLHGTRLDVALRLNVEKLDARYPDGFAIRCMGGG